MSTQREIKFRVWDNGTKSMVFEGFHVMGEVTAFGGIESHIDENPCGAASSLERWKDFVLMQYTGLKDRNGKDIYEGDICTAHYAGSAAGEYRNAIVWNAGECAWNFANSPLWAWEQMVVVGNIHEHPELLKLMPQMQKAVDPYEGGDPVPEE